MLAGLAAGLVINVAELIGNLLVVGPHVANLMRRLDLAPPGGSAVLGLNGVGFALGCTMAWTYAAMLPRLGPGMRGAVIVGLTIWLLFSVLPVLSNTLMGIVRFPEAVAVVSWAALQLIVAALVVARLYAE